jgi:tRNA-specific 2-thiouridylase
MKLNGVKRKKIVAAMSGGVDSSVSAYLLLKQGYEVTGAALLTSSSKVSAKTVKKACCTAGALGIPFHTFDVRDEFEKEVVQYFCSEYKNGRTPNPCIVCNDRIKFGLLMEKALELGAEYIATGHYARIRYDNKIRKYVLMKGVDRGKDQSYMLFSLSQDKLKHAVFPLGEYLKKDVRKIAREAGLNVFDSKESQEICFVEDGNCALFVSERMDCKGNAGAIVDTDGNILGEHNGIHNYTVGQRKGIGVNTGQPLYVVRIDAETNTIVVGIENALYGSQLKACHVNWVSIPAPDKPFGCSAKVRYKHEEADCVVTPLKGRMVKVKFNDPQRDITPGQAVVFYGGETVIGGGWILPDTGNGYIF